jgi:hypothetical protein
MLRKMGVTIAALAFGVVGTGAGSAAAQTADPAATQQDRTFRLYEHDDQGGGVATFRAGDQYLGDRSWDGQPGRIVNNNASSMVNDLLRQVLLYDTGSPGGTGCRGDNYYVEPYSVDDDFTNNDFDNKASCVVFG